MTQQQQEEVNLLKELIADSSISADERMIYEDALSELMQSEKPKASTERKRLINDIKPQKTTERKPRTTTQRKPQAPKQSKSDIESAKAEIKRRTGKTEEECESIVNEYRSLRAKSVERKKKETIASADNKDRVDKLKKDDKIISGTNEKTADAVIETTTKDVAEKIVKEIDKIEQKAEVEATKEVKKEMPKESTTEQNKAIAEKTEEKVKAQTKTIVKRIVIDTSSLLSSIAESLGKFDKDSQKEFLIKLRSDIDKLLAKFSYGGSPTQTFNITQSNMSSSSVNPTMFGGGGGVNGKEKIRKQFDGYYEDYSGEHVVSLVEEEDGSGYYFLDTTNGFSGGVSKSKASTKDALEKYVTKNYNVVKQFNGGGGVGGNDNSLYLRSVTDTEQYLILENIANHYGITQNKAYEEVTDIDSEALYEYVTDESLRMKIYNDMQRMAKGGNVYNRSWHQDHERFNKNEDYEIPLSSRKKKMFDEGGGVEKGYMVFNYTDNLYANYDIFATKKEANNFIKEFRNRYKQQGYYRDSNMNKIDVEDIDLEIIPSDFNPFRKFNNGGGVGSFENNVDYINWQGDNYIEDGGLEMEEERYSIIKKYIDFDTINGMVDFDDNINNSLSKSNNYDETIITANLSFYKGEKLVAKLKSFITYNESNDEGLTKETIFFDNDDFVNIQYTYGNTYTGFDPKRVYEKMLQNELQGKKFNDGGGVGEALNTEVILTENKPNGLKFKGIVKPFMLKSIEDNQYSGGFKRYEIDIYDEVDADPTKEDIKKANEFFDKIGGRYSKGGGVGRKNLDSIKNEYLENEDNNYHSENVVLLAKHFGTDNDYKEALRILSIHNEEGSLSGNNSLNRRKLSQKLIDKARKEMAIQGIEFKRGGEVDEEEEYFFDEDDYENN